MHPIVIMKTMRLPRLKNRIHEISVKMAITMSSVKLRPCMLPPLKNMHSYEFFPNPILQDGITPNKASAVTTSLSPSFVIHLT